MKSRGVSSSVRAHWLYLRLCRWIGKLYFKGDRFGEILIPPSRAPQQIVYWLLQHRIFPAGFGGLGNSQKPQRNNYVLSVNIQASCYSGEEKGRRGTPRKEEKCEGRGGGTTQEGKGWGRGRKREGTAQER